MKKFLFIALLGLISFSTFAQDGAAAYLPLVAGDTIVNTGTVSKAIPQITTSFAGIMLQCNLTKISGTGAGTAQVQAALDSTGQNWVNVGSAFTITNVATQTQVFYVAAPIAVYYRILFTGAGTESVQVKVAYLRRRYAVIQTY